jgi:hypothetical protein
MSRREGVRRWVRLAGLAAVATAIVTEQRKPPDEREWHGRLGGFLPYDFRPPTMARVRSALWDPESPRLVSPQVFGVGWTLNVGRLVHLARRQLAARSGRAAPRRGRAPGPGPARPGGPPS